MLHACVSCLRTLPPDVDIQIFTELPQRLEHHCPGASTVVPDHCRSRAHHFFRCRVDWRRAIWKTAMPLLTRSKRGSAGANLSSAPRLLEAVRRADFVVSSGGGFVKDDVLWWMELAGVQSVLAMAQRLGKPTAMLVNCATAGRSFVTVPGPATACHYRHCGVGSRPCC